MAEREGLLRRMLRAIDKVGDSLETSVTPWLVLTAVVFVYVVWRTIEFLVSGQDLF